MSKKQVQLFILPYAGGSIAAFKRLTDLIDDRIETITVEYPGRGTRIKEPLKNSLKEMLEDAIIFCQKRRNIELPYAVLGYSMGSVIAYEVLLNEALKGELNHIFIAAEVSPKTRSLELRKIKDPTDERIIERARILGGLDERILTDKRFSDIYIKPMISDYRNFFGYQFGEYKEVIRADTTFFYCESDTPREEVEKWSELIDGRFVFYELGDNHFFINKYYNEMARIINQTLCR